jgi:hypothetical protein
MDKVAFALEDYKLKVQYVTDQFSRMWNRFSFLLSLETAMVSVAIFHVGGVNLIGPHRIVAAVAGIVTGLFWYVVGAEDRYLVVLYRAQIRQIHDFLTNQLDMAEYPAAGEVEKARLLDKAFSEQVPSDPLQWRIKQLSTTRLAPAFPLLVVLVWGIWLTI